MDEIQPSVDEIYSLVWMRFSGLDELFPYVDEIKSSVDEVYPIVQYNVYEI